MCPLREVRSDRNDRETRHTSQPRWKRKLDRQCLPKTPGIKLIWQPSVRTSGPTALDFNFVSFVEVRSLELSYGVEVITFPACYHFDRAKDHEKVHNRDDL